MESPIESLARAFSTRFDLSFEEVLSFLRGTSEKKVSSGPVIKKIVSAPVEVSKPTSLASEATNGSSHHLNPTIAAKAKKALEASDKAGAAFSIESGRLVTDNKTSRAKYTFETIDGISIAYVPGSEKTTAAFGSGGVASAPKETQPTLMARIAARQMSLQLTAMGDYQVHVDTSIAFDPVSRRAIGSFNGEGLDRLNPEQIAFLETSNLLIAEQAYPLRVPPPSEPGVSEEEEVTVEPVVPAKKKIVTATPAVKVSSVPKAVKVAAPVKVTSVPKVVTATPAVKVTAVPKAVPPPLPKATAVASKPTAKPTYTRVPELASDDDGEDDSGESDDEVVDPDAPIGEDTKVKVVKPTAGEGDDGDDDDEDEEDGDEEEEDEEEEEDDE